MKWTNTFSALLVMMTMTFAFTSCDEDPWDDGWDYYDYSQGWYDDYDWYDDAFDYGNNTLKQEAQALRGYWTGKVENRYYDQQNQLQRCRWTPSLSLTYITATLSTDEDARPTMHR